MNFIDRYHRISTVTWRHRLVAYFLSFSGSNLREKPTPRLFENEKRNVISMSTWMNPFLSSKKEHSSLTKGFFAFGWVLHLAGLFPLFLSISANLLVTEKRKKKKEEQNYYIITKHWSNHVVDISLIMCVLFHTDSNLSRNSNYWTSTPCHLDGKPFT